MEKVYEGARVNQEAFDKLCSEVNKSLKGLNSSEFVELEPVDFEAVGKKSSVVSKLRLAYNLKFKGLSAPENIGITSAKVKKD